MTQSANKETSKPCTQVNAVSRQLLESNKLSEVSQLQSWQLDLTPVPSSFTMNSKQLTSVNTVGYHSAVRPHYAQYVVKKRPPVPPRRPLFKPPKFLKRPTISERSRYYSAVMEEYERRLIARTKARSLYVEKYRERMLTYESRWAKYLILLKLSAKGEVRYKPVKGVKKPLPNNPLTQVNFRSDGWTVDVTTLRRYPAAPYYLRYATVVKGVFGSGASLNIANVPTLDYLGFVGSDLEAVANSRALTRILGKLNDQSVHVGQIVAERAQTFGLFRDVITRLADLISLKKKFLKLASDPMKLIKQGSSDFLAFQFGVLPLIHDVYGAAKALAKFNSTDYSDKVVVRARESNVSETLTSTSIVDIYDGSVYRSCRKKVIVSYVLEYSIENVALANLQSLGLVDPAEIAWELMPWSFVIDWFLPVGDYITSLGSNAGLRFKTGTKTVTTILEQRTNYSCSGSKVVISGGDRFTRKGEMAGSRKTTTKVRTVLTSPPVPELPRFKNPLSSLHVAEAIALALQRVR